MKREAHIGEDWPKRWPAGFLRPGDWVHTTEADNGDLTAFSVTRNGQPIDSGDLAADELGAAMEAYGQPDRTE